jgi:hypothetical protein
MTSEELWAWLETCPTPEWEVVELEGDYCRVILPIDNKEEES